MAHPSKETRELAAKVLKDPKASKDSKTLAGSVIAVSGDDDVPEGPIMMTQPRPGDREMTRFRAINHDGRISADDMEELQRIFRENRNDSDVHHRIQAWFDRGLQAPASSNG